MRVRLNQTAIGADISKTIVAQVMILINTIDLNKNPGSGSL